MKVDEVTVTIRQHGSSPDVVLLGTPQVYESVVLESGPTLDEVYDAVMSWPVRAVFVNHWNVVSVTSSESSQGGDAGGVQVLVELAEDLRVLSWGALASLLADYLRQRFGRDD